MWLQLFGVGAEKLLLCIPLSFKYQSKYETRYSPSLMVSVCKPSLHIPPCFDPVVCSCCYFSLFPLVPIPSLYAHTRATKTGCCTSCFHGNASSESQITIQILHLSYMSITGISTCCLPCIYAYMQHYLNEELPLCFVLSCLFSLFFI